jgi:hypothetical protein
MLIMYFTLINCQQQMSVFQKLRVRDPVVEFRCFHETQMLFPSL